MAPRRIALALALLVALAGCSAAGPPAGIPMNPPEPGDYEGGGFAGADRAAGGPVDSDDLDNITLDLPTTSEAAPNLELGAMYDYNATENGSLQVIVPVVNDGNATGRATLLVNVTTTNRTRTHAETVELAPDEERTYRFVFDLSVEEFRANGSLDLDWRPESGDARVERPAGGDRVAHPP